MDKADKTIEQGDERALGIRFYLQINKVFAPKVTSVPKGAYTYENTLNLEWDNKLAIHRVYQISALLNRMPEVADPGRGGYVYWSKAKARTVEANYRSIKIEDKNIVHFKPVPHSDFMTLTINQWLKPKTVKKLSKITTSASYYPEGGELSAACGEMGANIITFAIIKMFDMGWIDLTYAQIMYDKLILHFLQDEYFPGEKTPDLWGYPMPLRDACEEFVMTDVGINTAIIMKEMVKRIKEES